MTRSALQRFIDKCEFDPITGCVVWIAGTSAGRGNSARYGVFWYEGRRWFAHRWAAVFIHGLNVGTDTVGHCCPYTPSGHPNTLCVEHLEVQTLRDNVIERNVRVAKARQTVEQRQNWLMIGKGYEEPPVTHVSDYGWQDVPFYTPPVWFQSLGVGNSNSCHVDAPIRQ